MDIRREIQNFIDIGPLPPEDDKVENEERVVIAQSLLEKIPTPVTDDEAQKLSQCFGPDNCYGLSWSLLHLIETAPGKMTAEYSSEPANPWVDLLNARVAAASEDDDSSDDDALT